MTKANITSEPSMEEILASIRKIIAEEPPGSRPTPPKPVLAEDRVLTSRDAFWRTPAAPAQRIEPTPSSRPLSPTPSAAAAAAKAEAPIFPAAREPNPLFGRDDSRVAKERETARKAEPRDIDEQLSDLLSDERRPIEDDNEAGGGDDDAYDEAAEGEQRNLTVSRVGFEPEDSAGGVDPFDFDLGPSPFSAREERQQDESGFTSPADDEKSQSGDFDLSETVVAAAQEALWSNVPVAEKAAAESLAACVASERSAQAPVETAKPAPAKADSSFTGRDLYNTPSVAATIGPIRKLAPYPDILTPSPAAAAPTAEQKAQADAARGSGESLNFVNRAGAASKATEDETVLFQRADGALTPAPISMSLSDLDHRTMEDTVADLLRPMLKQWLTENMPKIVERALRRELLERGPNHKSAAE